MPSHLTLSTHKHWLTAHRAAPLFPRFTQGLTATLAGIAPYAAFNFAAYDLIKGWYYGCVYPPREMNAPTQCTQRVHPLRVRPP